MSKTPFTLKKDIEHVVKTGEGWTDAIAGWVAKDVKNTISNQLNSRGRARTKGLRMSNVGQPCERKLWYSQNLEKEAEEMLPSTLLKFMYGDMTESLLIGLAMAAGHSIEGLQDQLEIEGIKGHRDCIISGMQFDVKSAATRSFEKFKYGKIKEDDPFGYLSQNTSYLYASLDDKRIKYKDQVGFLAFDKQHGHIAVDIYTVQDELDQKVKEFQHKKDMVTWENPPEREFEDAPQSKTSPNRKLTAPCSYCEFKEECWPGLRTFIYSSGPTYLTKVEKEPNVFEKGSKEGF